jgi:hypothetical protein
MGSDLDFAPHTLSVFVDIKLPRTLDLSVSIALIIPVYTNTTWIRRSTN